MTKIKIKRKKTTLRLDQDLYRGAKIKAATDGKTLTVTVEDALRSYLKNNGKNSQKNNI